MHIDRGNEMSKVYLVYKRWYEEDEVLGVHTNKEDAISQLNSLEMGEFSLGYDIEVWDTDTQTKKAFAYKSEDGIEYE